MLESIIVALMLAAPAWAAEGAGEAKGPAPAHEKAEDKARTAPGGASLGVKACHDDIERYCAKVKPGKGRLGACLHAHIKKLSKGCLDWAAHGGKAHVPDALLNDIDGRPAPRR